MVIGGGLAGIFIARERLGGKAGRAILDRIDVRVDDLDRYHFLLRGEYPRRVRLLAPTGVAQIWHNTFRGILPWYHNVLATGRGRIAPDTPSNDETSFQGRSGATSGNRTLNALSRVRRLV